MRRLKSHFGGCFMIKLNKSAYLDKLYACWLGKNIGGTLGAPYEGVRDFMDVQGFKTATGDPLPNDDLDLQLVWLMAMESRGAARIDANALADFWLEYLPPYWNEYGTCKTNLRMGLLPPMSGEVDNERWKNSNGAWIRSELWAALAPGLPDVAIKYAVADGMVDHGLSEGTQAEVFTATLQSLAYTESNVSALLESALSKIPAEGMVAKTVRLVMNCYEKGIPYAETRRRVVEFNKELGWFQAPGNLGFVTIGLLYGEGDFKKSVLYAINCGDDTDCTAATVGATLGIIGGTAGIPADWREYVGDRIVTVSISAMHQYRAPKTCTELTERVAALLPDVMKSNKVNFALTEGESCYPAQLAAHYNRDTSSAYFAYSPYSYEVSHYHLLRARVELDASPRVAPDDTRLVKLTLRSQSDLCESHKLQMRLILPDTWSAGHYPKTLMLLYPQPIHGLYGEASLSFEITAGELVAPINRAYMEITAQNLAYPMMIPIVFIG